MYYFVGGSLVMSYKKNINGKLALGYGSKYQLLRMLGWHRNDFNSIVAKTLNIDENINWLDFEYNGPCDDELLNLDFIVPLKSKWKEYWKCGNGGLNWDAVGLTCDGTYIFVEAKTHLTELNTAAGGSQKSIEHNKMRINDFIEKYGINSSAEKWIENHYQLANRLVITDFMNSNGYKAKLVYVLFENGFEYNASKDDSASKEEWIKVIDSELTEIGLKNTPAEKIFN